MPFQAEHVTTRYVGWLNDPEVVRYSDHRFRRTTLDECREYWLSFSGTPHYFWAVVTRDAGHIGNMTAHVDPNHLTADVGILIGERAAWRRGYGREAWIAVCRFLLESRGLRKVSAGTIGANVGMLALMRNCGMLDDGRQARQNLWEGREVDVIHAAIFRGEWQPPEL